jgi:hypothetical protein
MPRTAQPVPAMVIGQKENDVRPLRRRNSNRCKQKNEKLFHVFAD